jgi:Cell morphogenesis N-terminal
MNGMMRLIWTYCYRCNEPQSTATTKLESLLRHFFPANRTTIFPNDDRLEPFVYILHFIMSRHFEFGTDFCLELLNEHAVRNTQSPNIANLLAPERISIAIQAILLSLDVIEREESTPAWPTSSDFTRLPSQQNMETLSNVIPPSLLSHLGVKNLMDRCGPTLALIAASCANSVGNMLVMDDQWSYARINPSHEEAYNYIIRRHPEGTVTYPIALVPQINVLKLCFQSWPRCLHPSLPLNDALDMLIRGTIHVEPMIREVAELTLKRFMVDPEHASALLSRFAVTFFDPVVISNEGSGVGLVIECTRLLNLWVHFVDGWIHNILARPSSSISEEEAQGINSRLEELEAGGLFLLSSVTSANFTAGVKIIRMIGLLSSHLRGGATKVIDALHGKGSRNAHLTGFDDALEESELERLEQWKQSKRADIPLRMADSDDVRDRALWEHVFSSLVQSCLDSTISVLKFREMLVAAATRIHPLIALAAGLNSRVPRGTGVGERDPSKLAADYKHYVDQWRFWVKIICASASILDSRPVLNHVNSVNTHREHGRIPSDTNFDRERMTTGRGLFRYLTPFLDAEHSIFRSAAVFCISSLPPHGYSHLLEDLNSLAQRQFFDEARSKSGQIPLMAGRTRRHERFYTAVTRIYFLTAHLLQDQRSVNRQAALAHVLKFVRQTQAFLTVPENRDLYTLQRLRRYFCGTVERVFDGLATLKDSDRFIPPMIHLSLYNLCEEWCQFGKQSDSMKRRLIVMQKAAATTASEPHMQAEAIERFQTETKQLSAAAVGALTSLCVSFSCSLYSLDS